MTARVIPVQRTCPNVGHLVGVHPGLMELIPGPYPEDLARDGRIQWVCPTCWDFHVVAADWTSWVIARSAGVRVPGPEPKPGLASFVADGRSWWLRVYGQARSVARWLRAFLRAWLS